MQGDQNEEVKDFLVSEYKVNEDSIEIVIKTKKPEPAPETTIKAK